MVRSMTGFGKATCEWNGDTIAIELSSVNHRFLDASLRLPFEWAALDAPLKDIVRKNLSRGKVNISISRKRTGGASTELKLDRDVALHYIKAAREVAELLDTKDSISLEGLLQCPGVLAPQETGDNLEEVLKLLGGALEDALGHLDAMRRTEGATLAEDLRERVACIGRAVERVEARVPSLNEAYATKLRTRVAELAADSSVTEERLAVEVALMAEKGDVTEELVRLRTHLAHADELFSQDEAVGRKLNFLSQEIQREINTLGSKVRDTDVVREVLEMKSELEKIREQIQNIE